MAITDNKILSPIMTIQNLTDKPTPTVITAAALKAKFDEAPESLRIALNSLIDDLVAEYASKNDVNGIIAGQINTLDPVTGKRYVQLIEGGNIIFREVV